MGEGGARPRPPAGDRTGGKKRKREAQPPDASAGPAPTPSHKSARRARMLMALHTKGKTLLPALSSDRPFAADPTDHCETPFKAYRDIEPFLFRVAQVAGKPKAALRIYDPYYCEGSVVKHLGTLGFEQVYNRAEDFYAILSQGAVPDHDVVVTNPPFSGDHIERALRFCVSENSERPWILLLPNFIYKKRSCAAELALSRSPPFFLVPASTYTFWSPGRNLTTGPQTKQGPLLSPAHAHAMVAQAPAEGKPTTPFECMWYLSLGGSDVEREVQQWWRRKYQSASGCCLAASPAELPERAKPKRAVKRPNPKARKRLHSKGFRPAQPRA